ncbi:MAG TPA: hypothetical protein VFY92_00995 [Hyphomicrobiaceae bacterium]|nr:hypothetical protein [Hyphomicrobiaceae bacterium]
MLGARIFVAIAFVVLGASFVASTALLIYEFRHLDWLTVVVTHSHLFLFYPVFGLLALVAFYLPSVVLTHLYWNHVPYGRLRFIGSFLALAVVSYGLAWTLDREPRAIYEVAPRALLADKGDAATGRLPILTALEDLRDTAQTRFGIASFGRSCVKDPMLEPREEMLKERHCFPAGKKLAGDACCAVQAALAKAVSRLEHSPATRSLTAFYDETVFLPLKTFFILVVVVIAVLLALWRDRIDDHYRAKVARLERGVLIGAFAMLFWLGMDYGYQQSANVLFGRNVEGPQLRLSLVLVPWAILLLFYFLRRLGERGELVGQISGVVVAGVAVLRYDQLNDWVVRLFGIGADGWVLAGLFAIVLVGLIALFWPGRLGIYGSEPARSA